MTKTESLLILFKGMINDTRRKIEERDFEKAGRRLDDLEWFIMHKLFGDKSMDNNLWEEYVRICDEFYKFYKITH